MSYTSREFEKYILSNRKKFIALSKLQERELGRLYIQFAEVAKLEADKIVNTVGLTYANKKALISRLMQQASELTDNFKGVLDKALIESANLGVEADRIILSKYEQRLAGVGIDLNLTGFARDIPDRAVRAVYNRIWEDGLKLSDRIWTLNRRTRRELERIITEEIAAGRSASSKVLEARLNKLLNPDRRFIRTSLHGRNVSFDAARILRTERTLAFREANIGVAKVNPGNRGIKWVLSGSERTCSICQSLATTDSYGLGAGVFPVNEVPVAPHPQCMCDTYEICISSKQLTNDWIEFTKNKDSQPHIKKWYQEVYKKIA